MSTSAVFTGSSNFAADLQQVVSRAVSIASLPITQLTATKTKLQNQSSALTSLDQKVASLQSATKNLGSILSGGLFSSSTSTTGVVAATVQANATAGDYSIEVLDTGSYSAALSQPGSTAVSDPSTQGISDSQDYTLTVDGVATTVHAASTSLNDLVDAINTQGNGSLQATIVNVGGSSSPDYRVSFRASKLGALDIQLNDGTSDLIASQTPGALASYKVNGSGSAVSSDSRTVTLAPGLQIQLVSQSASGQATTVTVKHDGSKLQAALSNIANAYNSVVDEIATHVGQSGGALQGDSILATVSSTIRAIASYSNGTPDTSLAAYGLTLDSSGHLNLDATVFQSAADTNFNGLVSLIGSTGKSGFLQAATDSLNGLEDSTTGLLKLEEQQFTDRISSTTDQITDKQNRVNDLQNNLLQRMATADSAIAALEQRVSYITNLFQTQRDYNNQNK